MKIRKIYNFKKIRKYILIVLLFCVVAQSLFFDTLNTLSAMLIGFTTYWVILSVFRSNVFSKAMFASFVVLSFNISILSGPLIFQTLLFTPVTNNLEVPLITFFLSSLFQISILIALLIYVNSKLLTISSKKLNFYLKKLGVMRVPSKLQLWIMGIIGLSVTFYYAYLNASGGVEYGDVGNKFLFGLKFLTYTPFLIFFREQMSEKDIKYRVKKIDFILIGSYFTILLVGAIALNSRGTFAQAILIVGMLTILFILNNQLRIKKIKKKFIIILLLLGFIQPILSDLAIAMVLARSERGNVTPIELINKTIEIYKDKQAIEERIKKDRLEKRFLSSDYNEYYIDSTFLSRFLDIKFFDNMFALDSTLNQNNSSKIIEITNQKIMAIIPTPILKLLGTNLNKDEIVFSMGDYMLYLDGKTFLGGFKVGSSVAHGFAMFGWFIYIFVIPLFMIFFTIIESLSVKKNNILIVSPILMLMVLPLYYVSHSDSLIKIISYILRNIPQNILIYLIIFYIVYFITKIFKRLLK